MKVLFLYLSLTLSLLSSARAAFQVTATVDSEQVTMGEQLTLSISVKSNEEVQVSEPRVPNLNGFNLENSFQDSSQSFQLRNQNGSMQYEKVLVVNYNYVLTPVKLGALTIPGFEVVVDGKNFNTSPIKIQVLNPQAKRGQQPQRRGGTNGLVPPIDDPFDDPEDLFNQLLNRKRKLPNVESRQLNINPNEAFFVLADVDKREVYEGEQVLVSWYLYTRGNILGLDRVKFPELKGFWKEIIEEVPALNYTEEIVNGIPYRKALLASHALFPIKPGTSVIDEYKIKAQVQIPTNPMSVFGFGKPYSFNRASERIPITVKPLPVEGRPANFSGAVGQFEVRSQIEEREFPVNQPFSLKIRFEGQGNAKLIELPHLELPPGVEIYDTKSDAKFFKDGRSYKEFEVLIIPRAEGDLKIPALELSLFDPLQKKYVTKATSEYQIKILPNAQSASGPTALNPLSVPKKSDDIPKSAETLPEIVLSPDIAQSAMGFGRGFLSIWAWAVVFVAIFLGLGFRARRVLGWGAKNQNLQVDLQKRLKKVDRFIQEDQWRNVGSELANAIAHVLGALSETGGAGQQSEKLIETIPPSIRHELEAPLRRAIERNQILSFAPESVVTQLREKAELLKNRQEVEKLLIRAIEMGSASENAEARQE